MLRALFVVFTLCFALALAKDGCPSDKLTVYKVIVNTFWTRTTFPKHFPDWRPPAQWTKTIGRSHDRSFTLFKLGARASTGLKVFAETGRSEPLDAISQSARGVFDEFAAPPITSGAGNVEARFFVDGNHSKVSLMTRIVPSPDWFIGVDSFDLCVNGNWLDSVTIELDPVDAGTDNGFTFTAPNWPTEPQGVVYRITHTYPPHPAGSFYYPFMKRLPALGTYQFVKLREYELAQEFEHSGDHLTKTKYDVIKMEHVSASRDLGNDVADQELTSTPSPSTTSSSTTVLPAVNMSSAGLPLPRGDKDAILNSIVETYRSKQRPRPGARKHRKTLRPPRDCRVSEWGAWGECSKSCGIGEMQRHRQVTKHARRGGTPCPPLIETKWCGSARACNKGYFNW